MRLVVVEFMTLDGVMEAPGFEEHRAGRNAWALKVSDEALLKANDTIRKMFAYRHDILKAMIAGETDPSRLAELGSIDRALLDVGLDAWKFRLAVFIRG